MSQSINQLISSSYDHLWMSHHAMKQNKAVEERTCKVCESGEVENEFHFICSCTLYINIWANILQNITNIIHNIRELNEVSKIKTCMSKNFVCRFAILICDMF